MTKLSQKEMEINFAKSAANALKANWSTSSSPCEGEWPDLIVTESENYFGLEVREIYVDENRKGSQKKATECINSKAVTEIAKNYYTKSSVSIHAEFLGDLKGKGIIVDQLVSRSGQLAELEKYKFEPYTGCTIYVKRLPESLPFYNRWLYVSDRVGCSGLLTVEVIQDKISEKSEKLERYRTNI